MRSLVKREESNHWLSGYWLLVIGWWALGSGSQVSVAIAPAFPDLGGLCTQHNSFGKGAFLFVSLLSLRSSA